MPALATYKASNILIHDSIYNLINLRLNNFGTSKNEPEKALLKPTTGHIHKLHIKLQKTCIL